MSLSKKLLGAALSCAFAALACGGDPDDAASGPPSPVGGHPLCVLSVDCPDGQHCDLGECIQDCNIEDPCSGDLVCSPRARCLEEGQKDQDPDYPRTSRRATLSLDPPQGQLLETARTFALTLSSSDDARVEYRVSSMPDYLMLNERRGGFENSTVLEFSVIDSALQGLDDAGSIKIFTSLGEVAVPLAVKRGITGKYQGSLRYTTNGIGLGDARLVVELIDRNGDLDVLVDPKRSLLFPEGGNGPATGFGSYVEEEGAAGFSIVQRLAPDFGGARNNFQRELSRRITVEMKRTSLGGFEGTFEESVYGLFDSPVKLGGTIFLSPRLGEEPPAFELTPDVQMVNMAEPPYNELVDGFWGENNLADCAAVMEKIGGANFPADTTAKWKSTFAATRAYNPLPQTMATRTNPDIARTYADVVALCQSDLTAMNPQPGDIECTWYPAVFCAASYASGIIGTAHYPEEFQEFFAGVLNPGLLIAQEYSVQALNDSIGLGGLGKERAAYDQARQALSPIARWALHPRVVGYLAGLSPEEARGPEPTDESGELQSFVAARAMARLLQVGATIDGERGRIDSVEALASDTKGLEAAQARALLTLLESLVLIDLTEGWGVTPDLVHADLSGLLNPLDNGFGALVEGARSFGVPDGYVPFVWRPEDAGGAATNFEQMLKLATQSSGATRQLEDAYIQSNRAFEQSESELMQAATSIALTYDSQIHDICGGGFAIDSVDAEEDWAACGKGKEGDVGAALLSIEQADQRIAEQLSRIQGMRDKMEIDQKALNATQAARGKTLEFMDANGKRINALQMAVDTIDLAQEVISVASQTSLFNFGGPAVGGAAIAILGVTETNTKMIQRSLEQSQSMALPKLDGQIELINGMANIQRQCIDIQQATVEIASYSMEKVQTQIQTSNLVARAKRLFALRKQAQSVAALNPAQDPSFRLVRDDLSLQLLDSRARSQRMLYLAGRALEYEVNTPFESLGSAVLAARSGLGMDQLSACFEQIHSSYRVAFGNPQSYTTELSVREMLGITGPRTDEATGEELSAGRQFRLITRRNENYDSDGALTITFATNLQPDNGLWSTDVCGDRVANIQAQLVGDQLGDNEAQVNLDLTGTAILRACDSNELRPWNMNSGSSASSARAIVQAGVNSFGTAEPNNSLFGQSVARATWKITIPPGKVAPTNADLDLTQLEDIVLRIEHKALPRASSPLNVDVSCLASIN